MFENPYVKFMIDEGVMDPYDEIIVKSDYTIKEEKATKIDPTKKEFA